MMQSKKYLQSFGRTKSRKLRGNDRRLLAEVLPQVKIGTFLDFGFEEIWLEIGFGDGGHLLHQAIANPQVGFIGCEPFINGTAKLLRGIEENGLENVRIFQGDFRELFNSPLEEELKSAGRDPVGGNAAESVTPHQITAQFGSSSKGGLFDRVFILFPDPWPKKKHNKRRLISSETLDILAQIMKKDARLRIATDHQDYAKWIVRVLLNHPDFSWQACCKSDWQEQPHDHIETKYQKKNLAGAERVIFFEAVCEKMVD